MTAVRYFFAALLVGSAFTKALFPEEAATLAVGYSIPPLLTAIVVQLELLVGIVLLVGCFSWWVLRATFAVFIVFASFSLLRAVAGFESCGCLGALRVSPWITFALDLGVLCALWLAIKHGDAKRICERANGRWKLAAAAYLTLGAAALALSLWKGPTTLNAGSLLSGVGDLVLLEPQQWIGRELPLLPFLSPGINIDDGRWTVVLYHHDCPKCYEAIPKYSSLAEDKRGSAEGVLLIELPPHATRTPQVGAARHARLSADRKWFVEAPVEIVIVGGRVTAASLELPSITPPTTQTP